MIEFKQITVKRGIGLAKEADNDKAFLPSRSDPGFSVEKFVSQERDPGNLLFGTFLDGELVGFIAIKAKDKNNLTIGPMYITKRHRGEGLGKIQVKKFLDWAKISGVKGIYTKTWENNRASLGVFKSLNFKVTEVEKNARINGDSTVKLFLEL